MDESRWMAQAEADLRAAETSARGGHFEWACFQAQQAAEKAVKAVLYKQGLTTAWGHSLVNLLQEAAVREPSLAALDPEARLLDKYYVPTRYPNGLAAPAIPATFYTLQDAQSCLASARSIWTACRKSAGSSTP
jgi:HEPN domain-containing protein